MNTIEILRNAIITWFDECYESYKGLDDPEWIKHVCDEINITKNDYHKIMNI